MENKENICLFCFERLKDPVRLCCGHSICAGCVEDARKFTEVSETFGPGADKKKKKSKSKDSSTSTGTEDDAKEGHVKCPLCGAVTPVAECKPDLLRRTAVALEEQAAAGEGDKGAVCGFCGAAATLFCAFCGALCQTHSDFLHVTGPMRAHEVRALGAGTGRGAAVAARAAAEELAAAEEGGLPVCREHHKRVEMYCEKCNTLVCMHCVLIGAHRGHACTSVLEALAATGARIEELAAALRAGVPVCDAMLAGLATLEGNVAREHAAVRAEMRARFAAVHEVLAAREREAEEQVEALYRDFCAGLGAQKRALATLGTTCADYVARAVPAGLARGSGLARYTLFRTLVELQGALAVVAKTAVPDESSAVCRVCYNHCFDERGFYVARAQPMFRFNARACVTYAINAAALETTRSAQSTAATGAASSHDGSAFYDPVRELVVSVSGNEDNCRTVLVMDVRGGVAAARTVRHENAVPFGSHGQYPVYDGRQYAYFLESESGDNNRFGRLDLDTLRFEELPPLPEDTSFREFCSAAIVGTRLYAVTDESHLVAFDTDARTWAPTPVALDGSCRLLADPAGGDGDGATLYVLCEGTRGLFAVDPVAGTRRLVADVPEAFDLGQNGEALLVALPDLSRLLFASLCNTWYCYDFEHARWTRLSGWAETRNGSAHLVILPAGPTALYHIDEESTWQTVDLS